MQTAKTIRKAAASMMRMLSLLAGVSILALAWAPARAQVSDYGSKQAGPIRDEAPALIQRVAITQKLNTRLPLDLTFRDEAGKTVKLGDYFGQKPAILGLVYYRCKMLCPEEIDGLVGALEMVKFSPGKDFNVLFVSIDPAETPADAAKSKAYYVKRYGRPQTAAGWHFLTGQQPEIDALAKAVGYGYTRVPGPDGKMTEFAHASAIQLVTPGGVLAQYYLGVDYSSRDLQLGLVEASQGKIGTPVDAILTYCYRYNPLLNRHDLLIARIVQAGCLLTMLILGSYMVINFRRDVREARKLTRKAALG
ncbi:SCO family protein [Silvibacterium dinghuense]|uniref:SCO family protein n=2 Tax=Silvibacterium dinghuense TaxID=1560006 RepID=A0A4Q1SLB5_9BACT|nr:SCO family protein [Silvibacterium dinghuense]